MTRIVAGSAGGRTLQVPDKGTRPTSDRVREALFSRLEHLDAVAGARVLDLYAGSGALGLEAASRGAADVVLVDSARAAVDVCRRNAATLDLTVRVVADRVLAFLQRRPDAPAHLVLVDPPYDLGEDDLAEVLAALVAHLGPGAVVVVERSSRSPEPRWPEASDEPGEGSVKHLVRTDQRRYGETVLWFAQAGTTSVDLRGTDLVNPDSSSSAASSPAPADASAPRVAP